jgi:hypothetical protein
MMEISDSELDSSNAYLNESSTHLLDDSSFDHIDDSMNFESPSPPATATILSLLATQEDELSISSIPPPRADRRPPIVLRETDWADQLLIYSEQPHLVLHDLSGELPDVRRKVRPDLTSGDESRGMCSFHVPSFPRRKLTIARSLSVAASKFLSPPFNLAPSTSLLP